MKIAIFKNNIHKLQTSHPLSYSFKNVLSSFVLKLLCVSLGMRLVLTGTKTHTLILQILLVTIEVSIQEVSLQPCYQALPTYK